MVLLCGPVNSITLNLLRIILAKLHSKNCVLWNTILVQSISKKLLFNPFFFVKLDNINLYKTLKFCYNRTWLRLYVYLFSILFIFTLLCLLICHKMVNIWVKMTILLWWKHDRIQWRTRRYASLYHSNLSWECFSNFYPFWGVGVMPKYFDAIKAPQGQH